MDTNRMTLSTAGSVGVLTLDRPGSSANTLDTVFFDEFNHVLGELEKNTALKGLVIASAKPSIFIAGADLNAFNQDPTDEKLRGLIRMGQEAFTRLSKLKQTKVAAIHGACLGGGLELALACDYRIATRAKATKLALPEVMLGILPAWGGSTRLPRLIGLPKASQVILAGSMLVSQKAKKLGIVDAVVHQEYLIDTAKKWATRSQRPKGKFHFANLAPVSSLIKRKVRDAVTKKTQGNYPAPLMALEVMVSGLSGSLEQSFKKEEDAFLKLVKSNATQNLIRIFFLQERAKRYQVHTDSEVALQPSPIKKVAVLGAGVMGAGIAHWVAARGYPVILKDISREQLAKGMSHISKLFNDGVKRRKLTKTEGQQGIDRVTPISEDIPLTHTDVVIEAVVEKLDLKKMVFKQLESRADSHTIMASNTSALSITDISESLENPRKFVGIHFFNPVHRMKLVEVVRGHNTSEQTLNTALAFVKKIGKLPVVVQDSPGFLVNRILMPYLMEAVQLFDEGHSIHRLDTLMLKFGMPMGPMRLIDEVGLDVAQHVATDLVNRLPHLSSSSDTLHKMMESGWMGKKSGQGFYDYKAKSKRPPQNTGIDGLVANQPPTVSDEHLVNRMVLSMVNEAARCLEEHVVAAPEDVDFGMIMGTGWAPFRGGPLRYADDVGIETIQKQLHELYDAGHKQFKSAEVIEKLANKHAAFYSAPTPEPKEPEPTIEEKAS